MRFDDDKLQKDLKELRTHEEEILVQRAADEHGLPYIDLSDMGISTDALALVSEPEARAAYAAGFKKVGRQVAIATMSPQGAKLKEIVARLEQDGYEIDLYLASQNSLERAWERYEDLQWTTKSHGSFIDITQEALESITSQVKNNEDIERLFDTISDEEENKRTSRLMEIVTGSAIATKSSDIHIEPQDDNVRLRFRQDGILIDILAFDHATYKQLLSRIKILSGMKLNVTKNAQDGRFTIDFNDVEIEIRVSTVPGPYGEGVVMRVLDPAGINVGLEQLGIEPFLLDILKREIKKPNGLILNTGPTGSGKTTTLYSLLKFLYNPEIKILTIEDPIEYHLEGIHQTQVDHGQGYDFQSGLRAAMRQDPDVILVGEVRDHETALAAMQASQTGHMVLSTLHTTNAAGAVPRLLDLGINHATLAQSMTMAIAQRLVRKLTDAKKKVAPTPEQEKTIREVLRNAQRAGKDLSRFGLSHDMSEIFVYEPVPDEVSDSGYKGRVGIFEAILVDDSIKDILEEKPSDRRVKKVAQAQGILTLAEDAVVKVLQGVTSYQEVSRVVDLTEDIAEELGLAGATQDSPEHDIVSAVSQNLSAEKSHAPAPLRQSTQTPNDEQQERIQAVHEIDLLIDYLHMLENHQKEYPDVGIEEKVQQAQGIIVDLLRRHHPHDVFLQQTNEARVEQEIDLLMSDLEALRQHQAHSPGEGVAKELQGIRSKIEKMKK